jgi:hypothetical protein
MAKGNWKPSVIKPKMRCRICGRVINKKNVYVAYLDGITPAHRTCAISKNREYTEWFEKPPKKTEIELTDSISIFVD